LTIDELVDATLRITQRVGVDGLTMHLVGEELGTSAMAAYHHVRNKQALLELAADAVLDRVVDADPGPRHHWERRLRTVLESFHEAYRPYPWVFEYIASTRGLIPPPLREKHAVLRILLDAGFDEDDAWRALGFANTFLGGSAIAAGRQSRTRKPGRERRRAADVSPARFTADDYWAYGLETLLAGLRTQLRAANARRRGPAQHGSEQPPAIVPRSASLG
jgi:AcrR family transcriptional regulator